MTVLPSPVPEDSERVSVSHLWKRAPMGVIGIILVQWCTAVVFGMGAVYAAKMGMSFSEVARFMGAIMGGAMVMQWPLGKLSDLIDRRWVMGIASLFAVAAAIGAAGEEAPGRDLYLYAFLFGGFCLSQYSLVVALTHDHLRPRR